ncbi:hypothetical protein [Thioflexithrix psekupsensis]|uniref:Uncharacterized protein n=1 Tax=Thioflexithrix psekupsensis TaxID=1570016 RepID=A0A251X3U1_9GAMM|nr:hypothetical protein [Thioflexithrix psekupsensis]OUD12025.1 hypothetical protein TPSD3_12880 [Thioflexithrix psekupsensis]
MTRSSLILAALLLTTPVVWAQSELPPPCPPDDPRCQPGELPPPPPPEDGEKLPPPPPEDGGELPPPPPEDGEELPPPPPEDGGELPPPPPEDGGELPPPPPEDGEKLPPPPPEDGEKLPPPPPEDGGELPPPPPEDGEKLPPPPPEDGEKLPPPPPEDGEKLPPPPPEDGEKLPPPPPEDGEKLPPPPPEDGGELPPVPINGELECPPELGDCMGLDGLPELDEELSELLDEYWEEGDWEWMESNWFDENFNFDTIDESQIAQLGCDLIQELRPEQFELFTSAVFDAFQEEQISCMPAEVFTELEDDRVSMMAAPMFGQMKADQLKHIPPTAIQKMQADQLKQIPMDEFCDMELEDALEFLLNANDDVGEDVLAEFVARCEGLAMDGQGQLQIPPETRIPARQLDGQKDLRAQNVIMEDPIDMTSGLMLGGKAGQEDSLLASVQQLIDEYGISVTQNQYGVLELELEGRLFTVRPDPNSLRKAPTGAKPGVEATEDGSFILTTEDLVEIRLVSSLRNPMLVKQAFAASQKAEDVEVRVSATGQGLLRDLSSRSTRAGRSLVIDWSPEVFPSPGRSGRDVRSDDNLLQKTLFNYADGTSQWVNASVLQPDTLIKLLLELPGVKTATRQSNGTFKVLFTDLQRQEYDVTLYPQLDVHVLELRPNQKLEPKLKPGLRGEIVYQVQLDQLAISSRLVIYATLMTP